MKKDWSKKVLIFFLVLLFLFAFQACTFVPGNPSSGDTETPAPPSDTDGCEIDLKRYGGGTVDLCQGGLRDYLELDSAEEQAKYLYENQKLGQDEQAPDFSWSDDGSSEYTVFFSDDPAFGNAVTLTTEDEFLEDAGFFIPGKTYYWKVEGDSGVSETDVFSTQDKPVRIIEADGAYNIRDIGGWTAEDGKTVKYGMLYRGGQLNGYAGMDSMTEQGKYVFREILEIRSELDLRKPGKDDGGQDACWWDKDGKYIKIPMEQYSCIIPEFQGAANSGAEYEESSPEAIRQIFAFLSDEQNYPVYYHCNAGADRTGTLAFLINGVLGVSYEDLTRDFEITSFMGMGNRWRGSEESGFTDGVMSDTYTDTYVAWGKMYELMLTYYSDDEDGSLSAAIENYLVTACGVEQAHIDALRDIMLE